MQVSLKMYNFIFRPFSKRSEKKKRGNSKNTITKATSGVNFSIELLDYQQFLEAV